MSFYEKDEKFAAKVKERLKNSLVGLEPEEPYFGADLKARYEWWRNPPRYPSYVLESGGKKVFVESKDGPVMVSDVSEVAKYVLEGQREFVICTPTQADTSVLSYAQRAGVTLSSFDDVDTRVKNLFGIHEE